MKRINYILFACVLTIGACTNIEDDIVPQQTPMTRGIVNANNSSITNPTLLTDWENLTTVVLNTSTPTNKKTTTLPWGNGAVTLMPESSRKDIKKEDGWTMLLHTFKNYGEDEKSCYMIFYNKFRGLLKVFYYLDEIPIPNNNFLWKIQSDNYQNCSLFNIDPLFSPSSDSIPHNRAMILNNLGDTPTNGITNGWNGFQINVPEYSTEYRNFLFSIQGYNKTITSFSYTGESLINSKGIIIRTNPDDTSISKNGTADVSKEGIENIINNIYMSSNGFIGGLIVKDAISQVSQIGYINAISNGLKYIGRISAYTNNTSQTRATTTDNIQAELKGKITANGEISSTLTSAVAAISGLSLYTNNEDLGVWSLSSTPKIYCERYTNVGGKLKPNGTWGTIESPYTLYPTKTLYANVVINPALEKYIVDKDISKEIIVCDSLEGKKYGEKREKPITQLLYRNQDIRLLSSNSDKRYDFSTNYQYRTNRRLFYDWKIIKNDGDLVLVTVKITFKYNNKLTTVISTKMYKPEYAYGDTESILQRGDPYIINDPNRFP